MPRNSRRSPVGAGVRRSVVSALIEGSCVRATWRTSQGTRLYSSKGTAVLAGAAPKVVGSSPRGRAPSAPCGTTRRFEAPFQDASTGLNRS